MARPQRLDNARRFAGWAYEFVNWFRKGGIADEFRSMIDEVPLAGPSATKAPFDGPVR